jgi:hypothetical protein
MKIKKKISVTSFVFLVFLMIFFMYLMPYSYVQFAIFLVVLFISNSFRIGKPLNNKLYEFITRKRTK